MTDVTRDATVDAAPTYAGRWIRAQLATGFRTGVTARTHRIPVDEPLALGGTDTGMTPYELLLASLSSCMVMTMRMYADRKGWPLDGAAVHLRTAPARDPDSAVRETGAGAITRIERWIDFAGPLTDAQRERLIEIADKCPVSRTLAGGLEVVRASGGPT